MRLFNAVGNLRHDGPGAIRAELGYLAFEPCEVGQSDRRQPAALYKRADFFAVGEKGVSDDFPRSVVAYNIEPLNAARLPAGGNNEQPALLEFFVGTVGGDEHSF